MVVVVVMVVVDGGDGGLKGGLEQREVEELKQDRRDAVSKFVPYAAIKAYEQVATMKEPFDLSKAKGYCSSYKKEHTRASNDFETTTFSWLDKFVADAAAPIEA
nr:hypothetical protein [Tanacetum cinerariifolium]